MVVNYRVARVTLVAHQMGVFKALAKTPATAEQLADVLHADFRGVLLLLRALVSIGLLQVNEGVFENGALAKAHLVPGVSGYLGSNLTYQELLWQGWSNLEKTIRTGKPFSGLVELLNEGPPNFAEEYLRSVENVSRHAADEIAQLASAWSPRRFLDIGGGLGTYCRAMVRLNHALEATLLDLPATLSLARRSLADCAESSRIRVSECDYLRQDFGRGFDLALLSHVTHDESFETNSLLVRKAYDALVPGGRLMIHDFVVDLTHTSPLFSALFSVNMLVYTHGGQVFSVEEYEKMFLAAGFSRVESRSIAADKSKHPTTLVTGIK